MTRWSAFLGVLAAGLIAGCSSAPSVKPEPVDVSGRVLLPDGQPASDVTVNFFSTVADQIQGGSQIKSDGKFAAKLTPGKYTYAFDGKGLKAVPSEYHANDAAHAIEVPAGGSTDLTIKLTK